MKRTILAAILAAAFGVAHAGGGVTVIHTSTSASGASASTAGVAGAVAIASGPSSASAGALVIGAASASSCRCMEATAFQLDKAWAHASADKGGYALGGALAASHTEASAFKLHQDTLILKLGHGRGNNQYPNGE